MNHKNRRTTIISLLGVLLLLLASAAGCGNSAAPVMEAASVSSISIEEETEETTQATAVAASTETSSVSVIEDAEDIPEYSGDPCIEVNGGEPSFSEAEITTKAFEDYSKLDELGRCGVAFANICTELMPTEERGQIGSVKPSGWNQAKYDEIRDSDNPAGYLYNRCHLIGFQLAGENANVQNLITGTRYFNVQEMLPFENEIADYVKDTSNHVLYRVTPIYDGDDLVAEGVQMEAYSVEDDGKGVSFNVFCYNIQPKIDIDYSDGASEVSEDPIPVNEEGKEIVIAEMTGNIPAVSAEEATYVLNTNTKKFHLPDCSSAKDMSKKNRVCTDKSREELISEGYKPCGNCNP